MGGRSLFKDQPPPASGGSILATIALALWRQ